MFRNWNRQDVYKIVGLLLTLITVLIVYLTYRFEIRVDHPSNTPSPNEFRLGILVVTGNNVPVPDARVDVSDLGVQAEHEITGDDGLVEFVLEREHLGKTATITIEKQGYPIKRISQTLTESNASLVVQFDQ